MKTSGASVTRDKPSSSCTDSCASSHAQAPKGPFPLPTRLLGGASLPGWAVTWVLSWRSGSWCSLSFQAFCGEMGRGLGEVLWSPLCQVSHWSSHPDSSASASHPLHPSPPQLLKTSARDPEQEQMLFLLHSHPTMLLFTWPRPLSCDRLGGHWWPLGEGAAGQWFYAGDSWTWD